jgi:hypothetical protein
MAINACSSEGYLGTISIVPGNVAVNSSQTQPDESTVAFRIDNNIASIPYTISASSRTNSSIQLDAEFKIESENLQTGQFQFNFTTSQIATYGIVFKENGFTFRFNSLNPQLQFQLIATNFYENYIGSIIVDSLSAGYGASVATLNIQPPSQAIQADNFLDYLDPQLLPPEVLPPQSASLNFEDPLTVSDKITVLNEYVYYSKQYEETTIKEENLLNINKNYNSIDIKKYFENIIDKNSQDFNLFSSNYVKELYPQFDKQKFLFPMYVEIKFETDISKTQLTTFLNKLGLLDYFCLYVVYILKYSVDQIELGGSTGGQLLLDSSGRSIELGGISSGTESNSITIGTNKNINNIIQRLKLNIDNINFSTNIEKYIGNDVRQYVQNSFQRTILLLLLEKQLFRASALNLVYTNQILMYKVSKYKLNQLIGEQYFINTFENQELTYFDTQVKYDTEYRYTISAIKVLQDGSIVEGIIPEYTIKRIKVVDNPPLPPDVTYIPFKGIDNQIMLNLNPSSGKYSDYPIIVRNEDVVKFQNVIDNSRDVRLKQEKKVLFETDDDYAVFELFRLETPPKSYDDYNNILPIETENTSILDDIEPNKKYYYIARVRDIHGNVSNSTKPIEVEMINENGTIFMVKREYMFGEGEKIPTKTMKKFLQIKPNNQQAQVTYPQATSNINEFNLGNKEVSLWNKQFLMRVTSKNTGKKIDVKFKMTYSKPN